MPSFKKIIKAWLIYSVLISAALQSDSATHTYIYFSIMTYCRILNIVPCAI